MITKMKKEDFNGGSPFCCWLKEELIAEVADYQHGFKNRGLIKKYKIHINENTTKLIREIGKLDDLPQDLRKVAVDIIKMDLDPTFEG